MKQVISDTDDQPFEQGSSLKKRFINDVIKGIPKAAKNQIMGNNNQPVKDETQGTSSGMQDKKQETGSKGTKGNSDPITGKTAPSKKTLRDLTDAASKLQMAKLNKLREELVRQRLKVRDEAGKNQETKVVGSETMGPTVKVEEKKPDPGAVARTLKQSQQTGEFKGSVGG